MNFGNVYCYDYLARCSDSEYCDENGLEDSKCSAYECKIISSLWNQENAVEDGTVTLTANGEHCTGKSAKFDIWESDCPGFDIGSIGTDGLEEQEIVAQELKEQNETNFTTQNLRDICPGSHLVATINNIGFSSNKFQTTWKAVYESDIIGKPDYYFNVIVDGNELSSSSNYLRVSKKCADNDGDGYGNPASNGCIHSELDCDDNNINIKPGVTEICNNKDDDCDGSTDEGGVCNCDITSASWDKTSATEGDSVGLTVNGNSNCNGKTVTFAVKEEDTLDADDDANSNPSSATFSNERATSSWTAEWQNDCYGA